MTHKPIADELDLDRDEHRLQANWHGTRRRMALRRRVPRQLAALVTVVTALGAVGWAAWSKPDDGPLALASGEALSATETVAEPRVLALEDTSRIELATGTRLEPLRNDARHLSLKLHSGQARFDVRPGGSREWVIEAGIARVRVLGTAFVVERGAEGSGRERLRVSVERGRVRVESDALPHGDRVLEAGTNLTIRGDGAEERSAAAPEREPPPEAPGRAATGEEPPAHATPRNVAPRAQGRRERDRESVVDALDASELLALADEARQAGRPGDATPYLQQLLTEHPGHPEAPLVAITLARATAERDPATAVEHLRLARRLGVPRLLDAEVCSTLARALERTGELEAARTEARACLGRHGTPLHHEDLRRLAGDSRR